MPGRRTQQATAFTLIETIIALSLTAVLMLLVWSTFDVYTKYETKGVNAAKQTALLRALHRQFRDDLLHVVGVDGRRPIPIDTLEPSTTASDPITTSAVAAAPENGYFIGTATDLHFIRFVTPEVRSTSLVRPLNAEPPSSSTVPGWSSRLRVVSYQPRLLSDPLQSAGTARDDGLGESEGPNDDGLSQLDSLSLSSLDAQIEPTPMGVDRRVRVWDEYLTARAATQQLGEITSTTSLAIGADDMLSVGPTETVSDSLEQELLKPEEVVDEIPEVRRLKFRYFDGKSWSSEWNSTLSGSLPVAIEVSLDLKMDYDTPLEDGLPCAERSLDSALEPEMSPALEVGSLGSALMSDPSADALPAWTTEYRWLIAISQIPRRPLRTSPTAEAGSDFESNSSPEAFLSESWE